MTKVIGHFPLALGEDFIRYWVTLQQPSGGAFPKVRGWLTWETLPRHYSVTLCLKLSEAHVGPAEALPGLLMQEPGSPGPLASCSHAGLCAVRATQPPGEHPHYPLQQISEGCIKDPQRGCGGL